MKCICAVLLSFLLTACASTAEILQVNSLRGGSPAVAGLWARAAPSQATGEREINIVYFHGIGWTQQQDALAGGFETGLARAHGLQSPGPRPLEHTCPLSERPPSQGIEGTDAQPAHGGVEISLRDGGVEYETDLQGTTLRLTYGGCVDMHVLHAEGITYNIYRFFWDDYFWDAVQYGHVGFDDAVGSPSELFQGRVSLSASLKDQLVTHGLADAAMYIGPVGERMREAARAAICIAGRNSATGEYFTPEGVQRTSSVNSEDACRSGAVHPGAFAFVTESLGSRLAFDAMREAPHGETTVVDEIVAQEPEVFMLANQIALIGIGDLRASDAVVSTQRDARPTIVAISEINDLLTYEVVPYVEQLWRRGSAQSVSPVQVLDEATRARLIEQFGFNAIDVRVRFAPPLLGVVWPLADPTIAHTGHAAQPMLMALMICGRSGGAEVSAPSLSCLR